MCKGVFSWENTEKMVKLWKLDAWSQILTHKLRCDTTLPICEKSNLDSQASIGHIDVSVSPFVRVFFPQKT
jgi:hypothetical protein